VAVFPIHLKAANENQCSLHTGLLCSTSQAAAIWRTELQIIDNIEGASEIFLHFRRRFAIVMANVVLVGSGPNQVEGLWII